MKKHDFSGAMGEGGGEWATFISELQGKPEVSTTAPSIVHTNLH